jgi:Flp pilus assembly protein TadG
MRRRSRLSSAAPRTDRQGGQILILFALVLTSLMGIAALTVDVVRLYDTQRTYRGVADAAALAGAQDLQQATRAVSATEQTKARADALVVLKARLNATATGPCPTTADIVNCPLQVSGGTHYLVDVRTPPGATCVTCLSAYALQVTIDEPQFPVTLAHLFGVSSWNVRVSSLAGLQFKPKYILEALRPSGNNGIQMTGTFLSTLYVDSGDLGTNSFATLQTFFGIPLDYYCIGALQSGACQPNGYRFDYANSPGTPPVNISAAQSRHLPTLIADPLYPYPVYPGSQGPASCTTTPTPTCFTASAQAIDVATQTVMLASALASVPAAGSPVTQTHAAAQACNSAGVVAPTGATKLVIPVILNPGSCPFTRTTTPTGADGQVLGKNASAISAQTGSGSPSSCPTSIPGAGSPLVPFWTCFKPGVYASPLTLCYPSSCDSNANPSSGNNYLESGVYYFKSGFTLNGGNLIGGAGLAAYPGQDKSVVLVVPAAQTININAASLNQVSLNWIAGCTNAVDTTTCLPRPTADASANPMSVPAPQNFPLTIEVERNPACFGVDGKTPTAPVSCVTRSSVNITAQTLSLTQFGGVIYAPTDNVQITGSFTSLFFNPAQFIGQLVTWSTTYSSSLLSTIHIQYPTLREIGIIALDAACTLPPYGPTC